MKKECSLNTLCPGESAFVKELNSSGALRRRLLDMGLVEGTEVECVFHSPAGDPTAYQFRGALIALRREDASQVLVRPL